MLASMKYSKSPKVHLTGHQVSTTTQNSMIAESTTPHPDARRAEHDKLHNLSNQITEMYLELRSSSIDEIYRTFGTDPTHLSDKEKKLDLDSILYSFRFLLTKLIKFCQNMNQLSDPQSVVNSPNVKIEDELLRLKRENEKLKLLVESSTMRIKDAEIKLEETIKAKKLMASNHEREINQLNVELRDLREHTYKTKEEIILGISHGGTRESRATSVKQRPTASTRYQHSVDFDANRTTVGMSTMGQDFFKNFTKELDKSKMHNLQKKHELQDFVRQENNEKVKDLEARKRENMIQRLKIQVEERERDYKLLKAEYERIYKELKSLKEKEIEIEKGEWNKEITSAANPIMQENLKKKLEETKQFNDNLKKQVKKYALNEKKVFIKEKAFEYERAEYRDKLGYLQDRVIKLVKINEELELQIKDPKARYSVLKPGNNLKKGDSFKDDDQEEYVQEKSLEKQKTRGSLLHVKSASRVF